MERWKLCMSRCGERLDGASENQVVLCAFLLTFFLWGLLGNVKQIKFSVKIYNIPIIFVINLRALNWRVYRPLQVLTPYQNAVLMALLLRWRNFTISSVAAYGRRDHLRRSSISQIACYTIQSLLIIFIKVEQLLLGISWLRDKLGIYRFNWRQSSR